MLRMISRLYYPVAMTVTTGMAITCNIAYQPTQHDLTDTPTEIIHSPPMKVAVMSLLTGLVWPLSLYDIYNGRYPLEPFRLLPSPWDEQANDAYLDYLRRT